MVFYKLSYNIRKIFRVRGFFEGLFEKFMDRRERITREEIRAFYLGWGKCLKEGGLTLISSLTYLREEHPTIYNKFALWRMFSVLNQSVRDENDSRLIKAMEAVPEFFPENIRARALKIKSEDYPDLFELIAKNIRDNYFFDKKGYLAENEQ